ncbi:hypothetical protein GQ651_17915 [Alphaproteobacteria bacterium GH1-50]|uniref:Lipoprotein n=1 Tax=Kangsaoukella pontilimi TaxID=2691042 RepID=A0A7C9ITH5_9RHOB|nr:hypothetical protein [Kangsaoukella pontilimi]MXQ09726.1 hypothetical protein [Kangsaoukella pontilimi]
MKRPIYTIACLGAAFALSGCGFPYFTETAEETVTAAPAPARTAAPAQVARTTTAAVEAPEEDEATGGPVPFFGRHVPLGIDRSSDGNGGGGGSFSGGDEGGGWG